MPPWKGMKWKLNIWKSNGQITAKRLFEIDPKNGNLVRNLILSENHIQIGPPGIYIFYNKFPLKKGILLEPGLYIISIRAKMPTILDKWSFRETTIDLGSDISANSGYPGKSFDYKKDFHYKTGTSAVDIVGY